MKPTLLASKNGRYKVWEPPADGLRYVCGIDIAAGKVRDKIKRTRSDIVSYSDDRPDYSAVVVLEIDRLRHVASWHGYLDTLNFSDVCQSIGYHYNTALLVPEVTGLGISVVERLTREYRYPNVYMSRMFNRVDFDDPHDNRYGFSTTAMSRPLLIDQVTRAIELRELRTPDIRLVRELQTMEVDDNGVARGRGKNKDDMVMALALALQGRHEMLTGSVIRNEETRPDDGLDPGSRMAWDFMRKKLEKRNDSVRLDLGGSIGGGRSVQRRPGLDRPGGPFGPDP